MLHLQKIIFSDFMGGLSPSLYYSAENQYQAGSGIDPIREPGILQPGFGQTDISNTEIKEIGAAAVNKFIAPGVSGDERFIYGYASSFICRLDSFDPAGVGLTDNASWIFNNTGAGAIGGMGEYRGRVYFAYGSDTSTMGHFTPGATPTFVTVDTDGTNPALLGLSARTYSPVYAFNDVLYIGNLNNLYSYDGTATIASALDIPIGYEIDNITNYRDFLVFSASRFSGNPTENITSATKVYFWDTVAESPIEIIDIPGETRIRGLRQWRGGLYLLGSNALYRFIGSIFEPIITFSVGGYTGNTNITVSSSMENEGLTTWKNYLLWPGTSEVFFYGSSDPRIPNAIYSPIRFTTGTPVHIFGDKDSLILVSGTSSVRIAIFETGAITAVTFDTRRINFGQKVKLKGIRIFTKGLASGDNLSTTARYRAGSGEGVITFSTLTQAADGSVSEKFLLPDFQPPISHCYLRFTFNGGAVAILPGMELWYEVVPDNAYRQVTPQS